MILSFIFLLTTTFAIGLALASSPLRLGLWILLLASLISCLLSTSVSSWFGFVLFLIYIGGLLVMFAYFAATTPNQQLSMLSIWGITAISSFLLIIPLSISAPLIIPNAPPSQTRSLRPTFLLINDSLPILSLLAMVLFFALVAVVKISFRAQGALRPFS